MVDLETLRQAVQGALGEMTAEQLAAQIPSVTVQTVRNFSKPGHGLRTSPRKAFTDWYLSRLTPDGRSSEVREASPSTYALGVLRGQADAVRRFMQSALAEQERLIAGLDRLGATPPVSRAKLDETGRRQLAKDGAKAHHGRGKQ